jgi:hypothetical protein
MATIFKRDNGYLARVRLKGIETSKTFRSHADAKEWAAHTESAILGSGLINRDKK